MRAPLSVALGKGTTGQSGTARYSRRAASLPRTQVTISPAIASACSMATLWPPATGHLPAGWSSDTGYASVPHDARSVDRAALTGDDLGVALTHLRLGWGEVVTLVAATGGDEQGGDRYRGPAVVPAPQLRRLNF